jgi:nucleoside triphosphate diphosphatase
VNRLYDLQDLHYLMSRLRDPDTGCPWDCEQDFASLVKYTLEEAFEVADTIERDDFNHLPEELGDLLFQVVFYARLGEESGAFSLADVVHGITAKLISRHPHVFPDGTLESRRQSGGEPRVGEIGNIWEGKKQEERASKGHHRLLADIPLTLPALSRAQKIQKRASKVGFDWSNTDGVLEKVEEEIAELRQELVANDRCRVEEEFGDLLFSLVNLARHLDIDSETALRRATTKFEKRFGFVEQQALEKGRAMAAMPSEELDTLWRLAKKGT